MPAEGSLKSSDEELEASLEKIWEAPHTLFGWLGTVDHKRIGMRYLVTAMVFLVVGGVIFVIGIATWLIDDARAYANAPEPTDGAHH